MELSIITLNHEHSYSGLEKSIKDNFPIDKIKVYRKNYRKYATYNHYCRENKIIEFRSVMDRFKDENDLVLIMSPNEIWGDTTSVGIYIEKQNALANEGIGTAIVSLKGDLNRRYVMAGIHEIGHLFGLDHHENIDTTCPMKTPEEVKYLRRFLTTYTDELCKTCNIQVNKIQKP